MRQNGLNDFTPACVSASQPERERDVNECAGEEKGIFYLSWHY